MQKLETDRSHLRVFTGFVAALLKYNGFCRIKGTLEEIEVESLFKLKENGTSVRTEIIAGLTTFMTMAYIIALNPNLLTGWRAGGDELWNAVFLATCLASGIAMICMAFLANKPFCLAPGMGLNSFLAVVVAQIATITGASYVASFQAALVIVFSELFAGEVPGRASGAKI